MVAVAGDGGAGLFAGLDEGGAGCGVRGAASARASQWSDMMVSRIVKVLTFYRDLFAVCDSG